MNVQRERSSFSLAARSDVDHNFALSSDLAAINARVWIILPLGGTNPIRIPFKAKLYIVRRAGVGVSRAYA